MKKYFLLLLLFPISTLAQSRFNFSESRRIGDILSQDPNSGTFSSPLVLSNSILFFFIGQANSVCIAGNFNDWQATPLSQSKSNLWVLSYQTRISEGKYIYRYKVDGFWINDPLNPNFEFDEGRQKLSILDLKVPFIPQKKYPLWISNNSYRFRYFSTNARIVTLAGSFNNWDPYAYQMKYTGAGYFEIDLDLESEKFYTYSFIVDGIWTFDPFNQKQYRNELNRPVSSFFADQINSVP